MNGTIAVHTVKAESVIAVVYRLGGFEPQYRVTVAVPGKGTLECGPDELRPARQALEQAELFIRHEEQMARMNRCPGCGDG